MKGKIVRSSILAILMLSTLWFGYTAGDCFFGELAPERVIKLPLLGQVEFRPRSQVEPGTFAIDISVEDLVARANITGLKTLVAYGDSTSDTGVVEVIYWLPRTDIPGTFYRASETTHLYPERTTQTGRLEIRGSELCVEPKRNIDGGMWRVFCVLLLTIVTCFCADKRRWTH